VEYDNKIEFSYADLEEAFPPCDPGVEPYGSRILVQVRTPKKVTKGGIHLVQDVRETEAWTTQVGKVIAVGPLAFKNRTTMEPWPEGAWCGVGEFVRIPRYGGDRWSVKVLGSEDPAMIVIFNDLDILGRVSGDPLAVKAFL